MLPRIIACSAALAGVANGNFVSPGLSKCMTIGPFHEGTSGKQDAVLTACTEDENQDFGLNNGAIVSKSGLCLTADAALPNSEVHVVECDLTAPGTMSTWDLTEHGYIKLRGTEQCLDVKAEKTGKKDNGDDKYESWDEIKQHDSVHLQVFDCHHICTTRVNQLWEWAPITGNNFGAANPTDGSLGPVGGNVVSPGLGKCLDIGEDQTVDALKAADTINVRLAACTDEFNQNFEIKDNHIIVPSLGKCVAAESVAPNANVVIVDCVTGDTNQDFELTPYGYMRLKDTELCIDVKAEKKADGTYENWEEIKAHETNQVHLYDCHEHTTERVNQLFEWSPVTAASMTDLAKRPECDGYNPEGSVTVKPSGSMPDNVEDAKELVEDDLLNSEDDLLNSYKIGDIVTSSPAIVLMAALLVMAATSATVYTIHGRRAPQDAERLMVDE